MHRDGRRRSTTRLVQQCQKIAAQLNSYATKVDKVHGRDPGPAGAHL
ncbi:hypothetical protein [Mycobacterium saskatchewanense]|nr:hypothetical protein [Mycobacterium saskatchewanense]